MIIYSYHIGIGIEGERSTLFPFGFETNIENGAFKNGVQFQRLIFLSSHLCLFSLRSSSKIFHVVVSFLFSWFDGA